MESVAPKSRPLQFVAMIPAGPSLACWGSRETTAVALSPTGLISAGGFGVFDGEQHLGVASGLPSLRVSSLTLWRGQPVVALEGGGFFRRRSGRWEEGRSGWGTLHIRALAESPAGELFIGAREGLFHTGWQSPRLERLDSRPVRSLAQGEGFVLFGGEEGLYEWAGSVERIETPDPWVESVEVASGELFVLTAAGLARAHKGHGLVPVRGGEDLVSGVAFDGGFLGLTEPPALALKRLGPDGHVSQERLPAPTRHLLVSSGVIFADTEDGLFRRAPTGWVLARRPAEGLPGGSGHVTAMAWLGSRIVTGIFDGGLVLGQLQGPALHWQGIQGTSAWGVNALLPAGGAVYVASLRGAARFDGEHLQEIQGPGAAFSLAATPDGVAVGYGQGVLLPGGRLLSAFHGLPGNQALALASGPALFVGTPSGLGAVEHGRVRWRVTQGEGRLPHPWVTALALSKDALYVGTYGGGVVRRIAGSDRLRSWSNAGTFEAFAETDGFKVNTGCLVEVAGHIYLGTDGMGLYRLAPNGKLFVPMRLSLPSQRVTALLPSDDALYIGTDQGIARLPLGPQDKGRPDLPREAE